MLFHRRGLLWLGSAVRYNSIGNTNFNIFHGLVALKIGSRLPKSNQLSFSPKYFCTSFFFFLVLSIELEIVISTFFRCW